MKKVITILFTIILCFLFVFIVSATEIEQSDKSEKLQAYIEEKIVPVIIGVATSIVALLGTLKGLLSALKGLKSSTDKFEKEQTSIKENSKAELEQIKQKYEDIKESIAEVPELLEKIDIQRNTIEKLEGIMLISAEILVLAYSANSELVRTGKAKQMTRLLEQIKRNEENINETI